VDPASKGPFTYGRPSKSLKTMPTVKGDLTVGESAAK